MPEFVYNPNSPQPYVNVATGGDVFGQRGTGSSGGSSGGGGGGSSSGGGGGSAPAAPAKTAAQKRAEAKRKAAARRRAAAQRRREAQQRRLNPLLQPFKTPAQLRAEAARLAALSVPEEATLRSQQQQEEAGLQGLTSGLVGRVGGVVERSQAGLRGLGDLYGNVVGQARTGAESALAAAGAVPGTIAPAGPSEAVTSELAGLGGALAGFVPAAQTTGAQLVGTSRQSLSKALADRATRLSENTAKYLQQLQGIEYERAVAQETAAQNAARLGLAQQEAQFEQQMDLANLGLREQTVAQGWARIQASAERAANRAGDDVPKRIRATQRDLLKNRSEIVGGSGKFTANYRDAAGEVKEIELTATTPEAARAEANQKIGPSFADTIVVNAPTRQSEADIVRDVVNLLVFEGMTRANARRWAYRNILRKPVPGSR